MKSDELDKLLTFLVETLKEGKDFTLEQAPQFVRELLIWRYYEAAFFVGLGAILILVTLVVWWLTRDVDDREPVQAACGFFALVGAIVCAINAYAMIQVTVAPRIVLVQMVREMLR